MSMHEPNVVNYLNIVHRYFNVIAAVRYNSYQVLEEKKKKKDFHLNALFCVLLAVLNGRGDQNGGLPPDLTRAGKCCNK